MEQKLKIAIIGLVALLLISLIFAAQNYSSKQSAQRQLDKLYADNMSLRKQAEDIFAEKKQFEERANSLNNDLSKAAQDRDELQRKYDFLDRAREDLIGQIKSLKVKLESAPKAEQVQSQAAVVQSAAPLPVVNEAYWGKILKAKTELEMQLANVRKELKGLQINNEQLQKENSAFQLDLTGLKRDKEDLTRRLDYNQKLMDSLTADLARAKNEKFTELTREKTDKSGLETTLKSLKSENTALKRQLKGLTSRKIGLEKKIADLQEKDNDLAIKFDQVNALMKNKITQIEGIKNSLDISSVAPGRKPAPACDDARKDSVELPPIIVRPRADTVAQNYAGLSGRVLAINRENNFLVIDIGQAQGIKVGDACYIYRDNKQIASLEVIQVRDTVSACDIKKESEAIKIGDLVR